VLKYPRWLFWNQFFWTHLFGEQLHPIPYIFLARQSYFRHPNQKAFELSKEMTFDCRLPNITELVFRGLFCPSSENLMKKALHEITANSQGLLNPCSIVCSLVTPQLHIITSPDTYALATNIPFGRRWPVRLNRRIVCSIVQRYTNICCHRKSHFNKKILEKVLLSFWWIWCGLVMQFLK